MNLKGTAHLTKDGKVLTCRLMYKKGRDFIDAAILLNLKTESHVYFHLICQGIEIILKSLLLFEDYDKYNTIIKTKIDHDLLKLYRIWSKATNQNTLDNNFYKELEVLNDLYKHHHLRYHSPIDILIDPKTINDGEMLVQLTKLINKSDYKLGIKHR